MADLALPVEPRSRPAGASVCPPAIDGGVEPHHERAPDTTRRPCRGGRDRSGWDRHHSDGSAYPDGRPHRTGLSRRGLLAAAGGIALATSGLLVPEWLVEEAAAGEKPGRRVQDHTNPRRRYDHRARSLDSRFPLELCDPYLLLRRVRAAGDV